ncbi:MAG: CvpA family protein [Bacteroidales bacterium]|jgi:membrane protein required for colicin V production|nr:CvpA family protein [Bacteroidales bacterium]
MKAIDALVLIFTIWFAIKGLRKGLLSEIFYILAFIAGGFAMVKFSDFTANVLQWEGQTMQFLASGVTFLAVSIAVILLGKACKSIINIVFPAFLDKLLGLLFGAGKILLLTGIVFYFLTQIDANEYILTPERKEASICYKPTLAMAEFLLPHFKNKIFIKKETDNQ